MSGNDWKFLKWIYRSQATRGKLSFLIPCPVNFFVQAWERILIKTNPVTSLKYQVL